MPTRNPNSYKGSYGSVLLVGGNENMGGAIILAASAAVYSGAGLVTVATHPSNKSALHARLPEAMFVDMTDTNALKQHVEPVDIIVLGPGLGRGEISKNVLQTVYHSVSLIKRFSLMAMAFISMSMRKFLNPLPRSF